MGEVRSKEIKECKEKAPKGRPKKISVFILNEIFENQCSTFEKVLPYAPADIDQLTWWKIHQEALPLLAGNF